MSKVKIEDVKINYLQKSIDEIKNDVKEIRNDLGAFKVKVGYLSGGISIIVTLMVLMLKGMI